MADVKNAKVNAKFNRAKPPNLLVKKRELTLVHQYSS